MVDVNPFEYHKPTDEQVVRIERIREAYEQLRNCIIRNTPCTRYQSLAITNLEQSAMWATKSVVFE